MELYKILIVDDEEEIRQGIIRKIEWEKYGFTIAGDAENGVEALELAKSIRPDIAIVDIRMPFMDGIELSKKLTEFLPMTKIVILSGCNDFEYAQKAISLNVIEYILKPINSEDIKNLLTKLKDTLDEERDKRRNIEILKNYYDESMPVMREQFLTSAIEGKIKDVAFENEIEKYKLSLKGQLFNVAAVRVKPDDNIDNIFIENRELLLLSAQKIIEDTAAKKYQMTSFVYLDRVVIISSFNEQQEFNTYINYINEVCEYFKNIIKATMTIGVGRVYEGFKDIASSYHEAKEALQYRAVMGCGKSIYIDDVEPSKAKPFELTDELEKSFSKAVKIGNEEDIRNVFDELFLLDEKEVLPISEYRIYGMEISMVLIKIMKSYNLNPLDYLGEDFYENVSLNSYNSIEEIKKWFEEKSLIVNREIKKQRTNSSKILVESAKEYIKNNYKDFDLSVDSVCNELHVSSTYFSTIFKKETDISFVNYVTEIRLGEAVKLLDTTDLKTSKIAEEVGYLEPNYFSYVFKKAYGMSPMRYRKRQ